MFLYSIGSSWLRWSVLTLIAPFVLSACGNLGPAVEEKPLSPVAKVTRPIETQTATLALGDGSVGSPEPPSTPTSIATPDSDVHATSEVQPATTEVVVTPSLAVDDALARKAQQDGTVRIVVGLDVPFIPEGELADDAAINQQHQAIEQAQDALLGRLQRFAVSNVTKFATIPFLSMNVDAAGLSALRADPGVKSIQADQTDAPSLAQP